MNFILFIDSMEATNIRLLHIFGNVLAQFFVVENVKQLWKVRNM